MVSRPSKKSKRLGGFLSQLGLKARKTLLAFHFQGAGVLCTNDLGNMEPSMYHWQEQMSCTPHRKIYRKMTPSSVFKIFGTRHNHRVKHLYDESFKGLSRLTVASQGTRYCGPWIFRTGMWAGFTACLLKRSGH